MKRKEKPFWTVVGIDRTVDSETPFADHVCCTCLTHKAALETAEQFKLEGLIKVQICEGEFFGAPAKV